MKTMTRLIVASLFILFIGITACKKCQTCEYEWSYTEDNVDYGTMVISDESCGNTFQKLPDAEAKFKEKRNKLETLLNLDPDKENIIVGQVTCTQAAY